MPRYVLTLIPLIAALLVGYVVHSASMSSSDVPTEAQIKKAPSYEETKRSLQQQSRGPAFDPERLKEALRRMESDEPVEPVAPRSSAAKGSGREVRRIEPEGGEWRENLVILRNNAAQRARRNGVTAGIIAGALGYVGLFGYFYHLGRSKPRATWQQAIAQNAQQSPGGAPAPAAPQQQTETPAEGAVELGDGEIYEPYEAPVDISEIESAHEQSQEKNA